MFRKKQNFNASGSCPIFIISDEVLDNGIVERKSVDASSIVIPPRENYDLEVLLKAGVNLKRVNCKVISNNSVTVQLDDEKPNNETANDKEN